MKLLAAAATAAMGMLPTDDAQGTPPGSLTPVEAQDLARDAWVFGLPLVYIDLQAATSSNVSKSDGARAPYNQFVHYRKFPDASNKTVVGFNVDTLYSLASLDLWKEPMVLTIPKTGDRFWIMQLIDAWNDVPAAPGSRTIDGKGGSFLVAGPNWRGSTPAGMTALRMPTNLVLLGGRTYTAGPGDYEAAHALQDQYKLVPLSHWGKPYTPPEDVPIAPGIDTETPVPTQVLAMSPEVFFNKLNTLLVKNPPYPSDAPTMARIVKIGVSPGASFHMDAFSPDIRKAISDGVADGQKEMKAAKRGTDVNGWRITLDMGRYGTNYPYRASWTFYGVGGNLAEDAVYPLAERDADGHPFDSAKRYILHFSKAEIPPVNAFWSLTMYDADSFLVPNAIDRFALGDRSNLTFAPDGSLTIYIQRESPGRDKESNWLPAPQNGPFHLALRLYSPKKEVAAGTWKPPGVKPAGP